MFRIGIACVWLLAASDGAMAESPAERGGYLVNTIMACGNCHTPRDADGKTIAAKAFSGGLTFTTPAFIATAPNITPDIETGIGSWSDAEIKRALVQGVRPDHGRLAGVPLAAIMPANFYKALLPDDLDAVVAYLRTVKPIRNGAPDPLYKTPVRRRMVARGFGFQQWTGPRRQGFPGAGRVSGGNARQHRRQHHLGPDRRHRGLDRSGNRARHHPGNCTRRADAQAADGLQLLCRTERIRPRGCHRLLAHGAAAAVKPSQTAGSTAGRETVFLCGPPRKRQEVPAE